MSTVILAALIGMLALDGLLVRSRLRSLVRAAQAHHEVLQHVNDCLRILGDEVFSTDE